MLNTNSRAGRFRLAWFLITLAAVNGVCWTLHRWNYENHYRSAQITVDFDDTRTLADAYRIPQSMPLSANHPQGGFLQQLKSKGVSSLGLYDLTLNSYRDNGRIAITPIEEATLLYPKVDWATAIAQPWARSYYRFVLTATAENQALLMGQILPHLAAQATIKPLVVALGDGSSAIVLPRSQELFGDAPMGFDPAQVEIAHRAGLTVTARVSNTLNLTPALLTRFFDDISATGAHIVIFSDDEVLGYDTMYKLVAREMQQRHLVFGNIEFTKQRGWQDFAKATNGQLVRVHSVGGDEAAKAKIEMLIDRFARALKERDIRVAYIRLIRQAKGEIGEDPQTHVSFMKRSALQQNLDFIAQVRQEIESQPVPAFIRPAMITGQAKAFGDYPMAGLTSTFGARNARLVRYAGAFIAGLGAVGGTLLLLELFFDLSARARRNWLLLGLLIIAVLSLSATLGAKLMALEAGCIFSAIGILWGGLPQLWDASRKRGEAGRPANESTPGRAVLKGIAILVRTSAITFVGPLIIVTLLNQWKFFSGTDKYLLPKATQLLPLLIVALAFAGEVFPHRVEVEGAASARKRAGERFRAVLNRPFTIRVALVLLVLAVFGMIWIARTGNDSGMEISPFELRFRALLERIFITRPRTKEIFVGMPAMIFASYFALRRQWLPALAAVVLATIGQADLLNTFCHIHTPFFYSLLRSIHGVWLGALVGAVALGVYAALARRCSSEADANRPVVGPVRLQMPPERLAAAAATASGSYSAPRVETEGTAGYASAASAPGADEAAAAADVVTTAAAAESTQAVLLGHETETDEAAKSGDEREREGEVDGGGRELFYHDESGRLRRR